VTEHATTISMHDRTAAVSLRGECLFNHVRKRRPAGRLARWCRDGQRSAGCRAFGQDERSRGVVTAAVHGLAFACNMGHEGQLRRNGCRRVWNRPSCRIRRPRKATTWAAVLKSRATVLSAASPEAKGKRPAAPRQVRQRGDIEGRPRRVRDARATRNPGAPRARGLQDCRSRVDRRNAGDGRGVALPTWMARAVLGPKLALALFIVSPPWRPSVFLTRSHAGDSGREKRDPSSTTTHAPFDTDEIAQGSRDRTGSKHACSWRCHRIGDERGDAHQRPLTSRSDSSIPPNHMVRLPARAAEGRIELRRAICGFKRVVRPADPRPRPPSWRREITSRKSPCGASIGRGQSSTLFVEHFDRYLLPRCGSKVTNRFGSRCRRNSAGHAASERCGGRAGEDSLARRTSIRATWKRIPTGIA